LNQNTSQLQVELGLPATLSKDQDLKQVHSFSHGSWIKSSNMPLNYLRLYINAKVQKGRMQKGRVGAKRQGGCKKAG
jgi:hypothetical protein